MLQFSQKKAQLSVRENEPELYELVKTYQIHSHSKSCRKYKNIDCRYSFGRFFTESTVIVQTIPDDMCDDEKQEILQNRANILRQVKEYIDTFLDPIKVNILDPSKPDFVESKDINCILEEIDITRDD